MLLIIGIDPFPCFLKKILKPNSVFAKSCQPDFLVRKTELVKEVNSLNPLKICIEIDIKA